MTKASQELAKENSHVEEAFPSDRKLKKPELRASGYACKHLSSGLVARMIVTMLEASEDAALQPYSWGKEG